MSIKIDINVCRVCMKTDEGTSLYGTNDYSSKFEYCTLLKASENDSLPKILCNKCIVRLKIAFEFKKQSEATDKHLRRVINHFTEQLNKNVINLPKHENDLETEDLQFLLDDQEEYNENFNDNESVTGTTNESNDMQIKAKTEIIENEPEEEEEEGDFQQEENLEDTDMIEIEEHGIDQDNTQDLKPNVMSYDEEVIQMYEYIEDSKGDDDTNYMVEQLTEENDCENVETLEQIPETSKDMEYVRDETGEQNFIISPVASGEVKDPISTVEKLSSPMRSNICTKCNKDFSTKTNLLRHLQTHDGLKPYQCNMCGARFTQNGSLKSHLLIHTGEKPFKCNVCSRGFTQSKSLLFHLRRHTGEKPYTCDKCGLAFRQKDGLKRHKVIKHTENEMALELHMCSVCEKVLYSKYTLAMHMKKHTSSETSYKCETCDKAFASKASLANHSRQHTGEKPFKCDTCGKEFAQKGSMTAHMKQHLEVKPYQCEECGKGFTQKHQIVAHLNIHANQPFKKFKCPKCHKSFSIKRNLLQHLRNHEQDDSTIFKCEDCNIGFNSRRGLKLHRNNQHKETVKDLNNCDLCFTPFITVNDLNQHIMAVHDEINVKCETCGKKFISNKLYTDHILEHDLVVL